MPRYHVNPSTGDANVCRSTLGRCPFGGQDDHHGSAADARRSFEAKMEGSTAHLEALKAAELHETLWATVRERARQDLTAEFGQAYAEATLTFLDEMKSQCPTAWGRTRAVFIKENSVVKVPLNGEGMLANSREISASYAYQEEPEERIPMAITAPGETKTGVAYAVAQRVTPLTGRVNYSELPDWVGAVDCAQVGYTKYGDLVAYDL